MTTVINTPAQSSDNNSGGVLIAIFTVIVVGIIFIYFGIPFIRSLGTPQVNIPAPVINMPDKVDVNVQQSP